MASLTVKSTSDENKDGPSVLKQVIESLRNPITQYRTKNLAQQITSKESDVPWAEPKDGQYCSAAGKRDVLFLTSSMPPTCSDNPDIVPRRSRPPLTEEEERKLEEQGVHRLLCHNDLSIMMARFTLDERHKIVKMPTNEEMNCVSVKKKIGNLMNNTDKKGVVLHYIGPGKKGTGDWCLSDGFITFREIMDLYTQHFRGRVLTIDSDCSYSGCWVREAMAFMDEQGVGPCGHMAKEKGMLLKVYSSCQAYEIPAELALSTFAHTLKPHYSSNEIYDGQHPSLVDFTQIQCRSKIDQPCTMVPGITWKQWADKQRLYVVITRDKGRLGWHCVFLKDDPQKIEYFLQETHVNITDFGEIVRSGWGENPPNEEELTDTLLKQRDDDMYNYTTH